MREIKIWQMVLIWYGVTFGLIFLGIIYEGFNGGMVINDIYLVFLCPALILIITLIFGKFNFKIIGNRYANFKKIVNKKEIITVVIVQLFLSGGLSSLNLGLLAKFNIEKALEIVNDLYGNPTNLKELIIFFIAVVILAPILEEIVFRRIFFKRLNLKFNFFISAFLSSLVFGINHEFISMISATIFGITCCILYKKYNNLLIPITVHLLNNLVATTFITISYLNNTLNEQTSIFTDYDIELFIVSGVLITTISMVLFIKFVMKNRKYLKKKRVKIRRRKIRNVAT